MTLARLDNPTQSLAAWPLIFQLLLMARAAAMALPEAVIALVDGPQTYAPIRRFSLSLAALSALGMLLLSTTPLLPFYLQDVQDAQDAVSSLAAYGTRLFLLYPALFVVVSWLRGLLINRHATKTVNMGMAINLLLTALILSAGVFVESHGITTAALALNAAIFLELIFLLWRAQRVLEIGPLRPLFRRWQPAAAENRLSN